PAAAGRRAPRSPLGARGRPNRRTLKAGGDGQRLELTEITPAVDGPNFDMLALNEALEKLELQDKRKADLVKLRFFAGLTIEEAAQALGVSTTTAENDWAYARCWLRLEMDGNANEPAS